MPNYLERLEMLYGKDKVDILRDSKIAVFGVGGVGSYVVEALARSGVGQLDVFDNDTVAPSNLNRQLIATTQTLGMKKTDAAQQRVSLIAPDCKVVGHCMFYSPETADSVDLSQYDFVVDAVDHVPAKCELAVRCEKLGVRLISSMGTGNKLHPEMLELADIYKTSVCPLARALRTQLKKRGVKKLMCVYSKEQPHPPKLDSEGKRCPASNSFVPSAAGLIIASWVVNTLTNEI